VSIIIPLFNTEQFIGKCINSIIIQTNPHWELIIVDDGSSDDSGIICDNMALNDSRIKVYHIENSGAAAARKIGVRKAQYEWLMFVDSDDTLPNTAIDDLLKFDNGTRDIIVGTINIDNWKTFKHELSGDTDSETYISALLLNKTSIGMYAKLIKRSLFDLENQKIPNTIFQNEDLLMMIQIAIMARRIYIASDRIVYNYLYRDNSISKSAIMPYKSWIVLFNQIEQLLPATEGLKKSFLIYKLRRLYDCQILKGKFIDASNDYIKVILTDKNLYNIPRTERKMIFLIRYKELQYMFYVIYQAKLRIKKIGKKALNRIFSKR